MTHYIAMAGLSGGYLPNVCLVADSATEAAQALAGCLDMGERKTRELAREYHVTLSMTHHGNEYAELVQCDCSTPEVHDDFG